MTVKLELSPEVEAGLLMQAQARGISLQAFLLQIAQEQSRVATTEDLSGEQWEQQLDALFAELPDVPVLSDGALKRESWYSDRG
jgi:hypothetical protein